MSRSADTAYEEGPRSEASRLAELEFLAENATDVIARHAPDGTYVYVSPASLRVFGVEPKELVGRSPYELLHSDDISKVAEAHDRVIDYPETETVRYRARHRDGGYIPVETTLRGVMVDGQVVEIHTMTRDITGRIVDEEARRQWELCFTSTKRGIATVDPRSNELMTVNPALAKMHQTTVEDLVGRPLTSLFTAAGAADLPGRAAAAEERGYITYESEHLRKDGTVFPVRVEVMVVRDEHDEPVYRIGWFEDISAELAQRHAYEDFENSFRHAPIGLAVVGLDGRFNRVNERLCEITGYPADELETLTFQEITHPDDLGADLDQVERLLAGESDSYEMEKRYFTKEGHLIWIMLSASLVREHDGAPHHFLAQIQDISQRKRMESKLVELADKDGLTGLLNRRRFDDELGRQVKRSLRYGEEAALLMLDVDNLKEINDSFGHITGDKVVRCVASAIAARVRATDIVARIGGDEFGIILLNVGEAEAAGVANEVKSAVRDHCAHDGLNVTVSVGIAHLDGGTTEAQEALARADAALYEAKDKGRNEVSIATSPDSD